MKSNIPKMSAWLDQSCWFFTISEILGYRHFLYITLNVRQALGPLGKCMNKETGANMNIVIIYLSILDNYY